ncbi:MAG TPA: SEC-C metal-binding domain-containing protein [Bryobacteraceae bacterium]|nr:SEC-C metal-binding domain-containing protein [Bryobacteraceae bacterium]
MTSEPSIPESSVNDEITTQTEGSTATGPRTEAGKSRSSQNALKTGLFSAHDFIRPGEEDEYQTTYLALMHELGPHGILEQVFADEIMSANWRLRRCGIIEASLALKLETPEATASQSETTDKAQRSVDRARAHSHSILRRSIAELRKLQTERAIRANIDSLSDLTGLVDSQKLLQAINADPYDDDQPDDKAAAPAPKRSKPITLADLEALMTQADKELCEQVRRDGASSFCKPSVAPRPQAAKTPRNAPCPCGSGRKFKKCCGNPAAVPQKLAA